MAAKITEDALKVFDLTKLKNCDFIIFGFSKDRTQVVVDAKFPDTDDEVKAFRADIAEKKRETNFAERVHGKFVKALASYPNEAKFAVIDCHFVHEDRPQNKLIMIMWTPDKTSVRDKMIASSTFGPLAAKLGLVSKLQCQDVSDLQLTALVAKATAK